MRNEDDFDYSSAEITAYSCIVHRITRNISKTMREGKVVEEKFFSQYSNSKTHFGHGRDALL